MGRQGVACGLFFFCWCLGWYSRPFCFCSVADIRSFDILGFFSLSFSFSLGGIGVGEIEWRKRLYIFGKSI